MLPTEEKIEKIERENTMKLQSKDDIICKLVSKLKCKFADRTYEQRRRGWVDCLEWVLNIEEHIEEKEE